jgi:hypothetical protein
VASGLHNPLASHLLPDRLTRLPRRWFLWLLFVVASLWGLPTTASAATPSQPPCAANATPSVSLDVPGEVANGPIPANIYAYQNDDPNGDNGVVGGTLTVDVYNTGTSPAQLVKTVQVPATRDPESDTTENSLATFIARPLGARLRIVVTYETSWTDYSASPTGQNVSCDQNLTTTTTVNRGLPPKLAFGHTKVPGNGEQLVLDMNPAKGDCESQLGGYTQRGTSYLSETWRLGRKRWQMFLTPCYKGATFRTPPGILAYDASSGSTKLDPGGFELWLGALAPGNFYRARYQFVVSFNHHALYRGHMTTYYKYTPGYRIYEGTDAFVNYCINGEHQTYSSNLRLYCNHPSKTVAYVKLS